MFLDGCFSDLKGQIQSLAPRHSVLYTWQDPVLKRELVWSCSETNENKDELIKVGSGFLFWIPISVVLQWHLPLLFEQVTVLIFPFGIEMHFLQSFSRMDLGNSLLSQTQSCTGCRSSMACSASCCWPVILQWLSTVKRSRNFFMLSFESIFCFLDRMWY